MTVTGKANRILHATIALFLRDGVGKITMDDIADHAKVSKVTIYKYFVDKDTLYRRIGGVLFGRYIDRLERLEAAEDEPLVRRLYTFMEIVGDFSNTGEFDLCKALAGYVDAVGEDYGGYLQVYRRVLLALIDAGIEGNLLKKELDRDMLFHYIDMGIVYYRKSSEYRSRMTVDQSFRNRFMLFYVSNIFIDGEGLLSED